MNKVLYIFGASGLSREVADIAIDIGYSQIKFIDVIEGKEEVTGFEIVNEKNIRNESNNEVDFIIGVGDGEIRRKIYSKFSKLNYINLIHPSVTFGRNQLEKLKLTRGNVICAGTRFTNNIKISDFGLYNLNVTVGHDCIIEDFVTISPGANISGNVHLKESAYIGTGATILQGQSLENKLIVGSGSTVGAGAVVVKNVSDNIVVKGIPAK